MDSPQIQREVLTETERRLTGGPDAIAAFELLPPDAREKFEGSPESGFEALWGSWLDMTVKLQALGMPPGTLCDASNTIAEAWNTAHAEHPQTA